MIPVVKNVLFDTSPRVDGFGINLQAQFGRATPAKPTVRSSQGGPGERGPRVIVVLSDPDAGVAEQDRGLIDWNAGQQHLDREGVAKHVAVAAFRRSIQFAEIGKLEQPAISASLVANWLS